jgi:hypothetical protein
LPEHLFFGSGAGCRALASLFDAFTTVVKAIMMRDHGLKRQRESEIAMGDTPEGDFRKAMRTLASAVSIVSTLTITAVLA